MFEVTPADAGLAPAKLSDLKGGDEKENAAAIRDVLAGKKTPLRDIAVLNAAAALIVAGKAANLLDGAALAAHSIESGAAQARARQAGGDHQRARLASRIIATIVRAALGRTMPTRRSGSFAPAASRQPTSLSCPASSERAGHKVATAWGSSLGRRADLHSRAGSQRGEPLDLVILAGDALDG